MKTKFGIRTKDFWGFVIVCVAMIIIGIVAVFFNQVGVGVSLILYGVFAIVFATVRGKEYQFQDERLKRINEKAGNNAFLAMIVGILFIVVFGKIIPVIKTAGYFKISAFVFFVGFMPYIISILYYKKKGVVK